MVSTGYLCGLILFIVLRYRQRMKSKGVIVLTPKKQMTRSEIEKRREYWRTKKQESRCRRSTQKQHKVLEKHQGNLQIMQRALKQELKIWLCVFGARRRACGWHNFPYCLALYTLNSYSKNVAFVRGCMLKIRYLCNPLTCIQVLGPNI